MDEDLQAVRDIVVGLVLPEATRQAVDDCLGRLPGLYRELGRTYEVRYRQEIAGVVQRLLAYLPKAAAEAATARLRAMQERLGIPGPDFTPPAPPKAKPRSRKAG